jgi:hypothetical protein
MSYEPEGNLASWLSTFIDVYEQEFETYWGLAGGKPPPDVDEEEWRQGELLDTAARATARSLESLHLHPDLVHQLTALHPGDHPVTAARELVTQVLPYDRLEIELCRIAVDRLFPAKERLHKLVLLLRERPLSQRAGAYLDRAARLYLWGFDAEVAIVCRSALEAALHETISEEELSQSGLKPGHHGFNFYQYLQGAERLGILPSEARAIGDEIRHSGNRAVHVAPGLTTDGFELLRKLTVLLCFLDLHESR